MSKEVKEGFYKNGKAKKPPKPKPTGCAACNLNEIEDCITPKFPLYGEGKKKILIVKEYPTTKEDERNSVFAGASGLLVKRQLRAAGIDPVKDIWVTYAVKCHRVKAPTKVNVKHCRTHLSKLIKELKPAKIITLGALALDGVIGDRESISGISKWTGHAIPDQVLQTWIFPLHSATEIVQKERHIPLGDYFKRTLQAALTHNKTFPNYIIREDELNIITKPLLASIYLDGLKYVTDVITFDYETTGIKPHRDGHAITCISIAYGDGNTTAFPIFDDASFLKSLKRVLHGTKIRKVAHNCLKASSMILMEDDSKLSIKRIVDERITKKVKCYDADGKIVHRKILHYWKNREEADWWYKIRIKTKQNKVKGSYPFLECTESHEIYTNRGKVKACNLRETDKLLHTQGGNSDFKEFLVGSYLGDGSVSKLKGHDSYRCTFGHSSAQKEYLENIHTYIKKNGFKVSEIKKQKKFEVHEFRTALAPFFREWHKELSIEKCIARLTLKSLAKWYMDDGTLYSFPVQKEAAKTLKGATYRASIRCSRFTEDQLDFAVFKINELFGKDICKKGKGTLTIGTTNSLLFLKKIAPFMGMGGSCMFYKNPFLSKTTKFCKWDERHTYFEIPIYSISKRKIKKANPGYANKYDLEIEEFHNYIADGVKVSNCQFEKSWTKEILGYSLRNIYWDTMIVAHILDSRTGTAGLKMQTYFNFGIIGYEKEVESYIKSNSKNSNDFNMMKECPLDIMLKYCAMDSWFTWLLLKKQEKELKGIQKEGYILLHKGAVAFAEASSHGFAIDADFYDKQDKFLTKKSDRILKKVMASEEIAQWDGEKTFNVKSGPQLQRLLFTILGYKPIKLTKTKKPSTDVEALAKIDSPFTNTLTKWRKVNNLKNTFLAGFIRETVRGTIRPAYNLHTTVTFRSSSNAPNFQNVPKHDIVAQKVTRGGIVPRPGRQLLEIDYSKAEVVVGVAYHHDPLMLEDLMVPNSDMHRDTAREIFMNDKITKVERSIAKSSFVFPEFYGSYYAQCAPNIWDAMPDESKQHLSDQGIKTYSRFEKHIETIENDFWGNRFKVYAQWKKDTWELYLKQGYLESYTGFIYNGIAKRNEVLNMQIQGCLTAKSKVQTKKGWIPIKHLIGKVVDVWTGFKWAKGMGINKGKAQLADIHLESGIVLKCDTRHKFKNAENEWVDFQHLKIGERVALPRLPERIHWNNEIDWWFILGFIIGDGWFGQSKSRTNIGGKRHVLTIVGGIIKKELLLQIQEFFNNEGFRMNYTIVVAQPELNKKEKYKIITEGNKLKEKLESFGMPINKTAHTKRIPTSVWDASLQNQANFMEGLWLADGARAAHHNRYLHMCNKELLQEVQLLTYGIGYDTFLSQTPDGWILRFKSVNRRRRTTRKYPKQLLDKALEGTYYKYDGTNESRVNKRCILGTEDVTQVITEDILKVSNPDFEIYRYDKIVDICILNKWEDTYTMSVEDELHQFVAENVICKNSAFHCLLKSFIEVNQMLKDEKFDSLLIGQVHDSLILDVVPAELPELKPKIRHIMCDKLLKEWDWLAVPMDIEAEISEIDGSWAEMKEEEI